MRMMGTVTITSGKCDGLVTPAELNIEPSNQCVTVIIAVELDSERCSKCQVLHLGRHDVNRLKQHNEPRSTHGKADTKQAKDGPERVHSWKPQRQGVQCPPMVPTAPSP